MDKNTFIEQAPAFYALGIAVSLLESRREVLTLDQMTAATGFPLEYLPLVDAGMRILEEAGVAETLQEAFGPPCIGASRS